MGLGYFRKARPHGRPSLRHGAARALLAALALVLFPAQAFAQSDDEVVDARAVVLVSGTLAKIQDMDFGQIAQPSIAGTVTLSPTPIPTCGTTGGLVRTGPCEAAEFAIMGRKNDLARVRELNSGVVTLTGPGGARDARSLARRPARTRRRSGRLGRSLGFLSPCAVSEGSPNGRHGPRQREIAQ